MIWQEIDRQGEGLGQGEEACRFKRERLYADSGREERVAGSIRRCLTVLGNWKQRK